MNKYLNKVKKKLYLNIKLKCIILEFVIMRSFSPNDFYL